MSKANFTDVVRIIMAPIVFCFLLFIILFSSRLILNSLNISDIYLYSLQAIIVALVSGVYFWLRKR